MSPELIAAIVGGVVFVTVVLLVGRRLMPKKLKNNQFAEKWKELQKFCASQHTWPLAIINADKLLDEALKKRRFSGKTMGERLVSAQKVFTNNDAVWFGHKLRNRLVHEESIKLTEKDVKAALVGFRQALRDLGALK